MKRGFTLIELMVAISIFIIVMTIAMGSILGVFDANRKSRSLKTVLNNLNLAVESMSKEMRYGRNYHCGLEDDTGTNVSNCGSGNVRVNFLSSDNLQISYRFNSTDKSIEKQVPGGDFIAVTAPEIEIEDLKFYVLGADKNDLYHPKVIMMIKSHSGTNRGLTNFVLETMVTQRALDNI